MTTNTRKNQNEKQNGIKRLEIKQPTGDVKIKLMVINNIKGQRNKAFLTKNLSLNKE